MRKPDYEHSNIQLYQGDCLKIMAELSDKSIDLVFADPPYGHNNNNNDLIHNWEKALGKKPEVKQVARPILNDGPEANTIFKDFLNECSRLLYPGCCCCCCCCGGGGPDPQFARWSLWMDEILEYKQMIVWDKGPIGMGWHYRRSYETILVGMKKGKSCRWHDETNTIENIIRPGQYGIKKIIPSKTQHPTIKPVALPIHFIKLHTQDNETVLDPFMGSGTTGIAALRTNRKFIGIELDPGYFEMARKRIDNELQQGILF